MLSWFCSPHVILSKYFDIPSIFASRTEFCKHEGSCICNLLKGLRANLYNSYKLKVFIQIILRLVSFGKLKSFSKLIEPFYNLDTVWFCLMVRQSNVRWRGFRLFTELYFAHLDDWEEKMRTGMPSWVVYSVHWSCWLRRTQDEGDSFTLSSRFECSNVWVEA